MGEPRKEGSDWIFTSNVPTEGILWVSDFIAPEVIPIEEPIPDSAERYCPCPDWEPNIREVNASLMALFARNPNQGIRYNGKPFSHCPWCGEKLKVKK